MVIVSLLVLFGPQQFSNPMFSIMKVNASTVMDMRRSVALAKANSCSKPSIVGFFGVNVSFLVRLVSLQKQIPFFSLSCLSFLGLC